LSYRNSQSITQPSLDALLVTINGLTYDKSSIFLFTDAPANTLNLDVDVSNIVLAAVERQLQISIIITAPYQMNELCLKSRDVDLYTKIALQTGGTILNLCQPYVGTYVLKVSSKDNLAEGSCSIRIVEKTQLAVYLGFTTDPSRDSPSLSLNYGHPQKIDNIDRYRLVDFRFVFGVGTSPARHARLLTCSARLRLVMHGCRRVLQVYGSSCTVAGVFGTSTARQARLTTCSAGLRLAIHGCRRVRHVYGWTCTVADVFGSSTGVRRMPTCHYESFFSVPFACTDPYNYFIATVTITTDETTVQRAQRVYCYKSFGVCLNGGSLNEDGTCACQSNFNGPSCENPICQNDGRAKDYACICEPGFNGQFCQYVACDSWNYLETHDVRQHEFRQITFVIERNIGMVMPSIYLQQISSCSGYFKMIASFVAASESNDIPKQYSLITFDENVVINVVSTSHTDRFVSAFNDAMGNFTNSDPAATKLIDAIQEAYKITIQPPSVIYAFTSHDATKVSTSLLKQRLGTQVNVFYMQLLDYPQQPTGFYIPMIGNPVKVNLQTALLIDAGALVVDFALQSISAQGGQWTVSVQTTSGSCFVQVRAESPVHVIPGFTSSPDQDFVKSGPFSKLDSAPQCVHGTRNIYGECICDDTFTGDYCADRICLNGGTASVGVCACVNGYYGDFCEQRKFLSLSSSINRSKIQCTDIF
uniref:Protocadherin Fat 4 n=1 Tax=Heligmosomoides polygyrus TaxID=6339 RepID=A0A8L8Q4V2_HELPZ